VGAALPPHSASLAVVATWLLALLVIAELGPRFLEGYPNGKLNSVWAQCISEKLADPASQ
jgi:hypothetical protein